MPNPRTTTAVALIAGISIGLPAAAAGGGGPRTELTSLDRNVQVDGTSSTYWRSLSGGGDRAVFTVNDDDLPGANGTRDVYVRDLDRSKTILVSRKSSGKAANDGSGDDPAISGNGRFIAFSTDATNLPGGDGGIMIRDLEQGKTTLASRDSQGDPITGSSLGRATLSADGSVVAFEVNDDDLPGADGTLDVYVRDRARDKTILVSRASDGTPIDTNSVVYPSISGNGRFVAFSSDSDVLPGADGTSDFYIRDLRQGTTKLVSRTPAGDPVGGGLGGAASLSFDGERAVFETIDPDLGADPSGSTFVRDLRRDTTTLASRTANDEVAIGYAPSISANGRYVVYESEDDDLPGTDGLTDVFRFDLKTKNTMLISRSTGGDPGDDDSFYASVSGGGGFVAFNSRADNLSGKDADGNTDTFVRGPLD